jgi:hypothetical protein
LLSNDTLCLGDLGLPLCKHVVHLRHPFWRCTGEIVLYGAVAECYKVVVLVVRRDSQILRAHEPHVHTRIQSHTVDSQKRSSAPRQSRSGPARCTLRRTSKSSIRPARERTRRRSRPAQHSMGYRTPSVSYRSTPTGSPPIRSLCLVRSQSSCNLGRTSRNKSVVHWEPFSSIARGRGSWLPRGSASTLSPAYQRGVLVCFVVSFGSS